MIASFGDRVTEDLYHGRGSRRIRQIPAELRSAILRKLDMIQAARVLEDLRSPPGNRLELLRGEYRGRHSIRINDQWRLVFRWDSNEAHDVKMIDYH